MNDDLKIWDEGADEYLTEASEENDIFKKFVDTPCFLSLLVEIKGKKVLDIGCGNGDFCKKLIDNNAVEVVGLDGSINMINAARKNCPQAKYIICDLMSEELPFKENYFDIVTAKMMLMNLSSLINLAKKIKRVLKNEGLFAIDVVHPFRPLMKSGDGNSNRYTKSFNYFDKTQGSISFANRSYAFYYRPIFMYLNDFTGVGLRFVKMNEVGVNDQLVVQFPELKSKHNCPVSLQILFKK
jgi:SAM-dependent methyltransferase